jgi:uncharacterized repeat protein (TIGR02543 family)
VREVSATSSASVDIKARVFNHIQGDEVTLTSATIGGKDATGLAATKVTVSAKLNYRVTMGDKATGEPQQGPDNSGGTDEPGTGDNFSDKTGYRMRVGYGVYAVVDPNKGVKGIAPLPSVSFTVTTDIPTAVSDSSPTGSIVLDKFPVPSVTAFTRSFAEKGNVNIHTFTLEGFDTSFKNPRPTIARDGTAVRADEYHVAVVYYNLWAPAVSLSPSTSTVVATALSSLTTGVESGTPGLNQSYVANGLRNLFDVSYPRQRDIVTIDTYIDTSEGANFGSYHKGERIRFRARYLGGSLLTNETNPEFIITWDESKVTFDPSGSISGTTQNGYQYKVWYAHVDDIASPTASGISWSDVVPAAGSNINAVKLTAIDPAATILAGGTYSIYIPLVIKSDASGTMSFNGFYTSPKQNLTRDLRTAPIQEAGIKVALEWENKYPGSSVQNPGVLQVLHLTPWVAGNNGGTYNGSPYLASTGTAIDLKTTVTIPDAAHLKVNQASLAAELLAKYGAGASVTQAAIGGSTVLTFSFGDKTASGWLPILDIPVTVELATATSTPQARAVISSTSDNKSETYRYDTSSISFNKLSIFTVTKSASPLVLQPGGSVTWTLGYGNFSNDTISNLKLVDVLPFNGDGRGTSGLSAPLSLGTVNVGSTGATVQYTNAAPASVLAALENDATGGTGITWTNTPTGATALRFTIAGPIATGGAGGSVSFTTTVSKLAYNGKLNNDMYASATELAQPLKGAAGIEITSTASKVHGIVYKDANFSGGYNAGDTLASGTTVTISAVSPNTAQSALLTELFGGTSWTTTTAINGSYAFDGVPAGDYTVTAAGQSHFKFIEPAGTGTHAKFTVVPGEVEKNFGLQATRWNLAYNVNTPSGATATGVVLPAGQQNISTTSASAATGTPTGVPVRTDGGGYYTFGGWSTTSAAIGGTSYAAGATVPAQAADSTLTLFAKWTYTPTDWNLTYNVNLPSDATQPSPAIALPADQNGISTASASAITGTPGGVPVKANGIYSFDGWANTSTGTVAYSASQTVPKQTSGTTKELFAHWTWERNTHKLSFVLNGADATPTTPISIGDVDAYGAGLPIAEAPGFAFAPTRIGYAFAGWYLDSGLTKTLASAPNMPDSDQTIYAKWNAISVTLNFDANGGVTGSVASKSVIYDAQVGTLPGQGAPTRIGYTLQGWSTAKGSSNSVNFTDKEIVNWTDSKTVYAVWTQNEYTVTYRPGDHGDFKAVSTKGLHYGDKTPKAPKTDAKTGYEFSKWKPAPTATVIGDAEYVAQWTKIPEYDVTYHGNGHLSGSEPTSTTHLRGDSATVKSAGSLARSGYTFRGWSTSASGSVTHNAGQKITITKDVDLYAVWNRNPNPPTPPQPNPPQPPTPDPEPVPEPEPAPEPEPVPQPEPQPVPEPQPQPDPNPSTGTNTDITPPLTVSGFSPEDQIKIEAQTGNLFTDLADGNIPYGDFKGKGAWSVLSLILSLLALIISVLLAIGAFFRRRQRDEDDHTEQDNDKQRKRGKILKVLTIVVGILTPIVWLILDNLNQPMVWINKWTLIVAIFFIVHIALLLVYKIRSGRKNQGEEDYETGAAAL